ncbi:MAG: hypothetical protein KGD65_07510 [Candidatus Lokiarchaeota archaeon]|nr:hypothetical protein [Candidatus Lokiarchaeota archaeon]
MAGLDRMYDTHGSIENYIEEQIRELLEDPMNEYQDPNWVQAALLFEDTIVPCERYSAEHLHKLAQDIVTKAEQHGNKWVSQFIPGIYNEKVIDPASIDMDNIPDDFQPVIYVNGYESPFKDLSGGEKSALSLFYRLALNKIINEQYQEVKTKDLRY